MPSPLSSIVTHLVVKMYPQLIFEQHIQNRRLRPPFLNLWTLTNSAPCSSCLGRLQHIHNAAARILLGKHRFDLANPAVWPGQFPHTPLAAHHLLDRIQNYYLDSSLHPRQCPSLPKRAAHSKSHTPTLHTLTFSSSPRLTFTLWVTGLSPHNCGMLSPLTCEHFTLSTVLKRV